jgi:hypothetical protein
MSCSSKASARTRNQIKTTMRGQTKPRTTLPRQLMLRTSLLLRQRTAPSQILRAWRHRSTVVTSVMSTK